MAEVEIRQATPAGILIPFAMHTAVLIFVHLLSIVIAMQILPELEASSGTLTLHRQNTIKLAKSWPVQLCWILSNIVGIVLFAVELVFVAYVKFYPAENMRDQLHVGTGTLVIVVVMFLLSIPVLIISARSVSKQMIQLHEQRLKRARELLDTINETNIAPDLESIVSHQSHLYEIQKDTEV